MPDEMDDELARQPDIVMERDPANDWSPRDSTTRAPAMTRGSHRCELERDAGCRGDESTQGAAVVTGNGLTDVHARPQPESLQRIGGSMCGERAQRVDGEPHCAATAVEVRQEAVAVRVQFRPVVPLSMRRTI